jgi:hypothetical protein
MLANLSKRIPLGLKITIGQITVSTASLNTNCPPFNVPSNGYSTELLQKFLHINLPISTPPVMVDQHATRLL